MIIEMSALTLFRARYIINGVNDVIVKFVF